MIIPMIKLKLNVDIKHNKAGTVLSLETDEEGNILDSFWSRRLKDSAIDNCVEIIKNKKFKKRDEE